jgi:hypothetical protein
MERNAEFRCPEHHRVCSCSLHEDRAALPLIDKHALGENERRRAAQIPVPVNRAWLGEKCVAGLQSHRLLSIFLDAHRAFNNVKYDLRRVIMPPEFRSRLIGCAGDELNFAWRTRNVGSDKNLR